MFKFLHHSVSLRANTLSFPSNRLLENGVKAALQKAKVGLISPIGQKFSSFSSPGRCTRNHRNGTTSSTFQESCHGTRSFRMSSQNPICRNRSLTEARSSKHTNGNSVAVDFSFLGRRFYNPGSSKESKTKSALLASVQQSGKVNVAYVLLATVVVGGIIFAIYKQRTSASHESLCQAEKTEAGVLKENKDGLKESAKSFKTLTLQEAIDKAHDLCQQIKDETGSPGLVVAVSVDGQTVWAEGLGYADIENRLPCKPETVIRIASVSKPITMAAVAKAMENGDLDLDKAVQTYVPQFPEKTVNGKKVKMTTRHLVSHLSGIRHYGKDYLKDKDSSDKTTAPNIPSSLKNTAGKSGKNILSVSGEFMLEEYYIRDKYDTTDAALGLFKDDPLVHEPGSKFLYSSHAWTLVAAVLEGATKKKYPDLIRRLYRDLDLEKTYLDDNEPIIYNRARFYMRNKRGRLVNAPYVDCSYKYAGGGMLSTMPDLLKFAHAMLYSFQCRYTQENSENQNSDSKTYTTKSQTIETPKPLKPLLPGYLKSSTVKQLWTPVMETKDTSENDSCFGLGWQLIPENQKIGCGRNRQMCIFHSGGAVGASSVLLILPTEEVEEGGEPSLPPPRGICVAMAVNLISVALSKTALQIANLFQRVSKD